MTPAQGRRKPGEIGVGGYPFTPAFDRQCGMRCIGDDLALQVSAFAQPAENPPVVRPRSNYGAGRAAKERIDKIKCLDCRGRRIEDPWIRDDSNKSLQD